MMHGRIVAQADTPRLPPAPSHIGPLRRDRSGKIEAIDPTTQPGTEPRRCAKGTICVGPGQAYTTLSAAVAAARQGDTIEIVAGTYRESVKIDVPNLTVLGIGGAVLIRCAGIRLVEDKACLLLTANGITLEDLDISGAELSDAFGANGACVRNESNASFTLRRIICHSSQEGVLSSGGNIVVENSEFYDNGWTDRTHNVYFGGDCIVTVRGSIFRDARVGHEFKSRCRTTQIFDSIFRSTHGSRDLDISDGGDTLVYRSKIMKGPGAASDELIGFAPESCAHPGTMVLKDVEIINQRANATITNYDRCVGHPIVLDGVTFKGIPPRLAGYILRR
jgi:hypothetical protein